METPNVLAMHFARMMDTDPNFTSGEQAVKGNAATHYNDDGTINKSLTADELAWDMAQYQEGKDDLARFDLKYTGRAIVADNVLKEVPTNAANFVKLSAGHVATTQAYRYAYAIRK